MDWKKKTETARNNLNKWFVMAIMWYWNFWTCHSQAVQKAIKRKTLCMRVMWGATHNSKFLFLGWRYAGLTVPRCVADPISHLSAKCTQLQDNQSASNICICNSANSIRHIPLLSSPLCSHLHMTLTIGPSLKSRAGKKNSFSPAFLQPDWSNASIVCKSN